jgi:D-glycero-alpha-D-manno-heptose-7-phosphate kinase
MDIKSIHAKAPTRIDLAGGTVDIWPLYLFLKNPVTVNLGINLYAEATVELTQRDPEQPLSVVLQSEDQSLEKRFTWSEIESSAPVPPGLELHARLLRYFLNKKVHEGQRELSLKGLPALRLKTRAQSPAGAGLGGSSSLSIAIIGALATWAADLSYEQDHKQIMDGERFIQIVRDVETTVIQVPAGMQDYYAAMYGGLQSLKWRPGTHVRSWLPEELIPELEKRILLFYSGTSRNSGINNWHLFKEFIDNAKDVRLQFQKITDATQKLESALLTKDWWAVGEAISQEWTTRKTLAQGITTPEIDQAFLESQKEGTLFGKICGAGGGGCFFIYLPTRSEEALTTQRGRIQKIFENNGMRSLEFCGARGGLEIQVNRG